MDSFKHDFQVIMRRIYSLFPVSLAHASIAHMIILCTQDGLIDADEDYYFISLNKAYSDILGG